MSELKIPQGTATHIVEKPIGHTVMVDGVRMVEVWLRGHPDMEHDLGKLIADAINVHNERQKTPSELAQRVRECEAWIGTNCPGGMDAFEIAMDVVHSSNAKEE